MYTPISCEFFDQLNVAMQRKIPSTVVYLQNNEKKTIKGLIQTMSVIDGFEYLILNTKEQIRLDTVLTFNGRRYKEEEESYLLTFSSFFFWLSKIFKKNFSH